MYIYNIIIIITSENKLIVVANRFAKHSFVNGQKEKKGISARQVGGKWTLHY